MPKLFILLFAVLILLFSVVCSEKNTISEQFNSINIIPIPSTMEVGKGELELKSDFYIKVDANSKAASVAEFLADVIRRSFGYDVPVVEQAKAETVYLSIQLISGDKELGLEGYSLDVNGLGIQLSAYSAAGLFYGVQTILQLLPPNVYAEEKQNVQWTVPFVNIRDIPRYAYRGILLDVARHIFPVEFIKKYIDLIAFHKMNKLQLHLTDDQGWRIEIKKYPKLAEISAFREQTVIGHARNKPPKYDGKRYGGFYTQEQIKEIVKYAEKRYVTIIPEIEMPGHALAVLAAYPELSCMGGPFKVGQIWGVHKEVFCAGNEAVFELLQDVLAEVADLFPGKYIHIGGDECPKTRWQECAKCQARIKAEGLKDEHELQSYFIRRMEKFLQSKGKRIIGWDEILEGGLAPEATVMSWRGVDGGIAAAKQGHDVIMTPTNYLYLNYYQADPKTEPLAIGGNVTLRNVYSYGPTPDVLTKDEEKFILGAQANVWTEYIDTPSMAEYMTLPRMSALAELVWSPKEKKNWEDFIWRLQKQQKRFDALKVNYSKGSFDVAIKTSHGPDKDKIYVQIESEQYNIPVRYTTDGTEPGPESPIFNHSFPLEKSSIIKAAIFEKATLQGNISSKLVTVHKALGKKTIYNQTFNSRYSAGGEIALVDGVVGSKNHGDGCWQGYYGNDVDLVIDFGSVLNVGKISAGFFHKPNSWAFVPLKVTYAVSMDGTDFSTVSELTSDISVLENGPLVHTFVDSFSGMQARYLKVLGENRGTCPQGHPGAGEDAWLYVDEIIVE
jgi:hexosaminidase